MKNYRAPSLVEFGKLGQITLGVGGTSPDVGGLNINCLTTVLGTISIVCTSAPTGAGS